MSLNRHQAAELKSARRTADNPNASDFEREYAEATIKRLVALDCPKQPPICKYCLGSDVRHGGAPCPVLRRFQAKAGRGSLPTDGQAAAIRDAMKADEEAEKRKQAKVDAADRQQRLF